MNNRSKKKKNPKLSEAEGEIMAIIWKEGEPLTSNFIMDHLTSRTWGLSTVMTALARLCEKGFVCCDRSTRTNLYTEALSEEAYRERESLEFLETMHGNSVASMILVLNNSGAISEEDIARLREIIERKPGDGGK